MKVQTNLSIDENIKKKAQQVGMDLSEVAEKAFRDKLNIKNVSIPEGLKCSDCGKKGEKETAEDVKRKGHFSHPDKLTWLWPNEIWICNNCLRHRVNQVPVRQ